MVIRRVLLIVALSLAAFAVHAQTYFAEIDAQGIVKRVIVIDAATLATGKWGEPKNWRETKMDGSLRKNYAGVGHKHDAQLDAFVPPKPFPSWTLDEATARWKAPVAMPADGKPYSWDESTGLWLALPPR